MQVIEDTKSNTLMPIIREKIMPNSIVYTDCYQAYNALDIAEFKHYRINHSELLAYKQIILMVLRTSGIKLNAICANIMVSQENTSLFS